MYNLIKRNFKIDFAFQYARHTPLPLLAVTTSMTGTCAVFWTIWWLATGLAVVFFPNSPPIPWKTGKSRCLPPIPSDSTWDSQTKPRWASFGTEW